MTNYDDVRASVAAKLIEWNVPFSVDLIGETKLDEWTCDEWRVSVGTFNTSYYTGTGHRKPVKNAPPKNFINPRCIAAADWNRNYLQPVAPSAADVLHSMLMDSDAVDQCFADWCDNYDYSSDSIKALNTYNACCEVGQQMRKVFTHQQREELRELLQDF